MKGIAYLYHIRADIKKCLEGLAGSTTYDTCFFFDIHSKENF